MIKGKMILPQKCDGIISFQSVAIINIQNSKIEFKYNKLLVLIIATTRLVTDDAYTFGAKSIDN